MSDLKAKINFKDVLIILVGTFIMALGINLVFDPMGLDTGGVTGLSIVIKYAGLQLFGFAVPVYVTTIIINVPLFLFAIKKNGWRYLRKTVFATAMLAFWLWLIPVTAIFEDKIVAVLFGGVVSGIGMGLVFSTLATTGGTDLFADLLHGKIRHITMPKILFATDGIIVLLGVFVFGLENVVYSIVVVFLVSNISDRILEGAKTARVAYIVSEKADEISNDILQDVDRGVTGIDVTGMYSGVGKKMLFVVVDKKQIVEVTDIVYARDPAAFMVIGDAREVLGEGFIDKSAQKDIIV